MPILVPSLSLPPEEQQGPPWPTLLNRMPAVSFTDPRGITTVFSDWERGWLLQPGAKGLDMPEYQVATDESPGIDGYEVRDVRAQGKTITLPIAFWNGVSSGNSSAILLDRSSRTPTRDTFWMVLLGTAMMKNPSWALWPVGGSASHDAVK